MLWIYGNYVASLCIRNDQDLKHRCRMRAHMSLCVGVRGGEGVRLPGYLTMHDSLDRRGVMHSQVSRPVGITHRNCNNIITWVSLLLNSYYDAIDLFHMSSQVGRTYVRSCTINITLYL